MVGWLILADLVDTICEHSELHLARHVLCPHSAPRRAKVRIKRLRSVKSRLPWRYRKG